MKRIVLIDASYVAYWRYHADQAAQKYGTRAACAEDWIADFIRDSGPDLAVVALDSPMNWRTRIHQEYKQQREPRPSRVQAVLDSLLACNPHAVQRAGYEADDIIATYVERNPDAHCLIVANDKDMHQLVSPRCLMLDPKANKIWDVEAVKAKHGVSPTEVRAVLAIAGDKADNIDGVPGVGPIKAAELINAVKWEGVRTAIGTGDAAALQGALSSTLCSLVVQFGARVIRNYEIVGLKTDAFGDA